MKNCVDDDSKRETIYVHELTWSGLICVCVFTASGFVSEWWVYTTSRGEACKQNERKAYDSEQNHVYTRLQLHCNREEVRSMGDGRLTRERTTDL